jgi:hypothetical protein
VGSEDKGASFATNNGEVMFDSAPSGETSVTVNTIGTEGNAQGTATVTVVAGQAISVDVPVSSGPTAPEGEVVVGDMQSN